VDPEQFLNPFFLADLKSFYFSDLSNLSDFSDLHLVVFTSVQKPQVEQIIL